MGAIQMVLFALLCAHMSRGAIALCSEAHCEDNDDIGLLQVKVESHADSQWNDKGKNSAKGVDEVDDGQSSAQAEAKKRKGRAELLLKEIQEMDEKVKSGDGPDQATVDAITVFRNLLNQDLLPHLGSARDTDAGLLDTMLTAITNLASSHTTAMSTFTTEKATVDNCLPNFNSCNGPAPAPPSEADCSEMHSFMDSVVNPMTRPALSASNADWEAYIQAMETYWDGKQTTWNSIRAACEAETTAHSTLVSNWQTQCTTTRTNCETNYCNWRNGLHLHCSTHVPQYNEKVQEYTAKQAEVAALIPTWRGEKIAISKIICYLDHWAASTPENPITTTTTQDCLTLNVDTSTLNIPTHITAGDTPAPVTGHFSPTTTCDTTVTNSYPAAMMASCDAAPAPAPAATSAETAAATSAATPAASSPGSASGEGIR
eukprot:gnl/TRDRNA2_/TRDRNA2_177277_c0_seq2.p1 gnl/TRDRNA2_/TRDRNA2_177277_c0~~gnl/TRDRNA2_/TRDRNA2_177277_c0_seq2.p1  ORF type:complete len:430 (+),score=48.17 gnl/TRDRNA2_/TRDRNA2_177277_c0_seq2:126-1415(+)